MGWMVNVTPRSPLPQERPSTHCIGGWVGPRAGLEGSGKCVKISGLNLLITAVLTFCPFHCLTAACGGAAGEGTAMQAERSQVGLPVGPLEFFF